MDIQNKDNLSKYVIIAFALLLYCTVVAYAATPEQVVLKSYEKEYSSTDLQECYKVISELQSVLKKCKDNYLASRIEYRVGVLYFYIRDYKKALKAFNTVAEKVENYDLLVSALNMKANCARFSGHPKESIVCFQELIKKIEKQGLSSEFENTIILSSYFSMAQIYEQIGDFPNAVKTYTTFIEKYESKKAMQSFVYKAMAAKAEKLFVSGDINSYLTFLKKVLDCDIPGDHKGVLELHRVCIEFILRNGKMKGLTCQAMIPVHALNVVANNSNCDTQDLLENIAKLNKTYEKTKSSVYIKHTYAWLLDLSGNKQDALEAFQDVIDWCSKSGVSDHSYFLGEYAKIQSSILLGELKDYNAAIKMVNSLSPAGSGHLLEISEAIKKSLTTLKREVPKNDEIK